MRKAIINTNICDECAHGNWNDQPWNRTPEGDPITIRCPFYRDGQYGIVRGTIACNNFKNK